MRRTDNMSGEGGFDQEAYDRGMAEMCVTEAPTAFSGSSLRMRFLLSCQRRLGPHQGLARCIPTPAGGRHIQPFCLDSRVFSSDVFITA